MKTNQIMVREIGFLQRTQDGYFNATKLVESWNSTNDNKRQLAQFLVLDGTKEYIEYLQGLGIDQPYVATRGRDTGGTWMHPKLFIDLCMWVSLEFKSKVIDMVLDGLILTRHEAGDYYKEMCACIMNTYVSYYGTKPPSMIFIHEANMLREIAGLTTKDRNEMTESELGKMTTLQKVNCTLLEDGVGKESRIRHLKIVSRSL